MNLSKYLLATCVSVAVLAGCAPGQQGANEGVGAVTGGALGGVLGSTIGKGKGNVAAIIGGTLLGALAGGSIGRSMDDVDRMKMSQTLTTAPTGSTRTWVNPDTNARYQVTPIRTYYSAGQPCREYTTTAVIGGRAQKVYGTACRGSDGNWRVVNTQE